MNVWIVGENTIGCTDNTYGWLIDGVFDSKAAAILRCTTPKHFIGPLELNKVYPDEQRKWEGAYYPLAEPDPQPSEKPAEPQLYICSAGYPNCAFCDIKEPHPHNKGCDIDCLNGKTCVPYVPEKETISGWWLNHITGKEEFATINIPPFIKVKIEDNQGYHLQHPASKVIESGYKCSHCGWWVIYGTVHFCPVKRATFFTQSKAEGNR